MLLNTFSSSHTSIFSRKCEWNARTVEPCLLIVFHGPIKCFIFPQIPFSFFFLMLVLFVELNVFWLYHCAHCFPCLSALYHLAVTESIVFAEFKRFTLDLTALFNGCVTETHQRVNASAPVRSRCASVWAERINSPSGALQMTSALSFHLCCINASWDPYILISSVLLFSCFYVNVRLETCDWPNLKIH